LRGGPNTMDRKEKELVHIEIENCRKNIEFYKKEIGNMEEKLAELERLKKAYEYY
jgi:hypothetical protein